MSALGGSVPVRSPAEVVSVADGNRERLGGTVVSLRNQPFTAAPLQQPSSPSPGLGHISPELVLVDPELGRAARELLPDLPRATPVRAHVRGAAVAEQIASVERLRSGLERTPERASPRRRVRLSLLSSATGLIAFGVLLTLAVGPERGLTPPQQQAQSVAGPVSSSEAAPGQPSSTSTTPAVQAKPPAPAHTSTAPAISAAIHAPALRGQTFVWVAATNAAAYEFQLFQAGERVFRARVDKPRLELPGRWRQGGRPYALLPGSYRWYVWPVSSRTKRQSTVATVQAKLVIE